MASREKEEKLSQREPKRSQMGAKGVPDGWQRRATRILCWYLFIVTHSHSYVVMFFDPFFFQPVCFCWLLSGKDVLHAFKGYVFDPFFFRPVYFCWLLSGTDVLHAFKGYAFDPFFSDPSTSIGFGWDQQVAMLACAIKAEEAFKNIPYRKILTFW